VKFCPTEAIKYLPKSLANKPTMNRIVKKLVELGPADTGQVKVGERKDGDT
jgi:hypothetical protein